MIVWLQPLRSSLFMSVFLFFQEEVLTQNDYFLLPETNAAGAELIPIVNAFANVELGFVHTNLVSRA